MAVTTNPRVNQHARQPQTKARSLSDLETLLARTDDSSILSSVSQPTKESATIMNATASAPVSSSTPSDAAATAAAAAGFAAAGIAEPAYQTTQHSNPDTFKKVLEEAGLAGDATMVAQLGILFEGMVAEMQQQTRAGVDEMTRHLTEGFGTLGTQVNKCIIDQGELTGKYKALDVDVQRMKKQLVDMGAPDTTKETSVWLRTAGVVKDVGAYSGAAILVGITGKVVYDTFFGRKSSSDE